jgi:hypothetical protein
MRLYVCEYCVCVCVTEVIVEWLAFLLRLQEIPDVDLGHPAILIVVFPNFPQSLQENSWDGPYNSATATRFALLQIHHSLTPIII